MDQSAFSTVLTVSLMHDLKQCFDNKIHQYFLKLSSEIQQYNSLKKRKQVLPFSDDKKTSEIYHLINTPRSNSISTLLP